MTKKQSLKTPLDNGYAINLEGTVLTCIQPQSEEPDILECAFSTKEVKSYIMKISMKDTPSIKIKKSLNNPVNFFPDTIDYQDDHLVMTGFKGTSTNIAPYVALYSLKGESQNDSIQPLFAKKYDPKIINNTQAILLKGQNEDKNLSLIIQEVKNKEKNDFFSVTYTRYQINQFIEFKIKDKKLVNKGMKLRLIGDTPDNTKIIAFDEFVQLRSPLLIIIVVVMLALALVIVLVLVFLRKKGDGKDGELDENLISETIEAGNDDEMEV